MRANCSLYTVASSNSPDTALMRLSLMRVSIAVVARGEVKEAVEFHMIGNDSTWPQDPLSAQQLNRAAGQQWATKSS